MIEHYESGGGSSSDSAADSDRSAAKIIVSRDKPRGVTNDKRFILNDLESALRIAKDGDTIFLEDGVYAPLGTTSPEKSQVLIINEFN